jgi:sugar lactone lactonase YvrE
VPQKNIKTLEDIVEQEAKVEKVLSGHQFTEGPAFSRLGFLVFSDIPANRIYKYVPGEQAQIFRENSNGSNGLTFDRRPCHADRKGRFDNGAGRQVRGKGAERPERPGSRH